MYKITIEHNNGRIQVIPEFPTLELDFYSLSRAIDKCMIKSYKVELAD